MSKRNRIIAWLLFTLLALTWGSSFILMKKALLVFDYTQVGMLRISIAFLSLLLIAFRQMRHIPRRKLLPLAAVGLFGNLIPYTLFPLAISKLDSSLVGILNSMVPLFTLIIGLLWFKIRVKLPGILGIITGLGGAIWLLIPDLQLNPANLIYGLLPIAASVGYAISINTINGYLQDMKPLAITLISLGFAAIPAIIYVLSSDFISLMRTEPQAPLALFYVALLAVAGTAVAVFLFNHLIRNAGSLFAASVTYAIPVVALFWGVADGEPIGFYDVTGMLAILCGVYLVNLKGSPASRIRKKPRAEVEG